MKLYELMQFTNVEDIKLEVFYYDEKDYKSKQRFCTRREKFHHVTKDIIEKFKYKLIQGINTAYEINTSSAFGHVEVYPMIKVDISVYEKIEVTYEVEKGKLNEQNVEESFKFESFETLKEAEYEYGVIQCNETGRYKCLWQIFTKDGEEINRELLKSEGRK